MGEHGPVRLRGGEGVLLVPAIPTAVRRAIATQRWGGGGGGEAARTAGFRLFQSRGHPLVAASSSSLNRDVPFPAGTSVLSPGRESLSGPRAPEGRPPRCPSPFPWVWLGGRPAHAKEKPAGRGPLRALRGERASGEPGPALGVPPPPPRRRSKQDTGAEGCSAPPAPPPAVTCLLIKQRPRVPGP